MADIRSRDGGVSVGRNIRKRCPYIVVLMLICGIDTRDSHKEDAVTMLEMIDMQKMVPATYALIQPSFSQLLVICAQRPQTTLPPAVTKPSSLTLTSMMVPLVRTPS